MKRIIGLLMVLFVAFTLSGCVKDQEQIELKIMVPMGSPALAQLYMEYTHPNIGDNVSYEIDVVSGTDSLVEAFNSASHDIIFAPMNVGANSYQAEAEYTFVATVATGNLFIATGTDGVFDLASLDGKDIVVFGQNETSDIILQIIVTNQEYTIAPTFTYVDSIDMANAILVADPTKIVLLAEPVLGIVESDIENLKIINLQDAWSDLTEGSYYPQSGIFVKDGTNPDVLDAYLREIQLSIQTTLENPSDIAVMADQLEYGYSIQALTNAIPRCGLEFITAKDSKTALVEYFNYILILNPALIGEELPDSNFYHD